VAMKKRVSKTEAKEKIESFFSKSSFKPEEVKKIKRLAMKYKIPLKEHRKKFCKKCLSKLKGKTRVTKQYKTIECSNCGHLNRHKLLVRE